MGETANEPHSSSLLDRLHSFARPNASGRTAITSSSSSSSNSNKSCSNENDLITPQSIAHDKFAAARSITFSNHDPRTSTRPPTSTSLKPHESGSHQPQDPEKLPGDNTQDAESLVSAAQEKSQESPTIEPEGKKPKLWLRIQNGAYRFALHTKDALFHSWINVLLIFVPVGIGMDYAPLPEATKPTLVFALNAVAIIPLAGLLAYATESVASRMGDTWAALLNVTFGNAVELIIFIIALSKNQIRIVQASILGSILANLLLILGMAFVLGGLRYREQIYNSTVTQMSACLLSLSVTSLLLPTAFHASFANSDFADSRTVKISRGTSIVLLIVYVLYLLFQLKSHAYMYESTPQNIIDEESRPGVLADVLNSSSSSESSSSSSDDSDSSGSQMTTGKRIRRALRRHRRRRSSVSSARGSSIPSTVLQSPVLEEASDNAAGKDDKGSYFPKAKDTRIDPNSHGMLSGDEADTDGERDRYTTQTRDFGIGQGKVSRPPSLKLRERSSSDKPKNKEKGKRRLGLHKKQKKNKKKPEPVNEEEEVSRVLGGPAAPLVELVNEADTSETVDQTGHRLQFARQISRPITTLSSNLLSKTVFAQPAPLSSSTFRPGIFPMSRAASFHPGLRRTNSLPDRLSGQDQEGQSSKETAQPSGISPANDLNADASSTKDDKHPQPMSRTAAVVLLLCTTGLVAFCAELLVDAIPKMVADTSVSQAFIGLIILPIVGNAAEHVTAVTVAAKNKMDLAIGVAVGSSIQIALFVTPFVVLLGWIMEKDMSLYFNLFETVSLFITTFIVNFLVLDGRSNYLEGSLLMAAYVIIAVAAFYYPNQADESPLGGGNGNMMLRMLL